MKQKISAHLSTLTPFLSKGGIDYNNLDLIGLKNVEAIVNFVNQFDDNLDREIEKEEERLLLVKDDVMETTEIASYIAYLRVRLGNRKFMQSNLKTVLSSIKAKGYNKYYEYPLLPTLRAYRPFEPGDDVMVYIGTTGLESNGYPPNRGTYLTTNNWVCAKVLSCVSASNMPMTHVFFNNPIYKLGSLEGHYGQILTSSPTIFTRKDFLIIKIIIEERSDRDFIELFFENCRYCPDRLTVDSWRDFDLLKKVIFDPFIEKTTDDELISMSKELFENAIKLTWKHSLFSGQAKEMAKRKGVEVTIKY